MASPFRVFRKNQKTMMVIASVVAIFVFVLGDSLVSYVTGSRNARNADEHDARAVAVHWDGGSLTNRQLNELVVRRRILNGFLKQVQIEGERSAYQAGVDPPPLRVQQLLGPDTPAQGVEQYVVRTKLFADAARAAGMKVSDETIVQYLDDLGRRNVTREQMRTILGSMQVGGGRASIDYVIDALREVMLANNFFQSHEFAFKTVTPQQEWKDWLLVNDRVVIEAAAVPAESFLPDVKEPTESELETLFNAYKDREAGPEVAYGTTELPSAVPGFKIPRKVDLQFVHANYDDYLTKAEAKITDADIAKYYDENKKLFEKADTGLMEDASKKKDQPKAQPPASKGDAKAPAANAKPSDTEKKSSQPEGKNTSSPGPATDSKGAPAENKNTKSQPPVDTKNPPATKDGKIDPAPAKEKQSSYKSSKNVFRLAAFEEKADSKKDANADKTAAPADSKSEKPADKPPTTPSSATPESKPLDTAKQPATTPPPPAPSPKAESPVGRKPAAPPGPALGAPSKNAPASTAKPADAKPVQYQPLSEVKDLIRRQLAEGHVEEQLNQLTGQIQTQLDGEFNKWFNEKLSAQSDKQAPPAPPRALVDLAPIVQKTGLKQGRTGPKSYLELRDTPIGKSAVADSRRRVLDVMFFGKELDLYQPVTAVDLDGNRYVVMKMSDTPARVPTLAEVRNEVVRVWKNQKAAELAKKHAEDLAKKAQEAKSPLTNFFADNKAIKVVRTDPFSQLTGGDVSMVNRQQQPFRLSQPDGIVAPGPDFMKRVFELKDGEVGVSFNHDHSIAYVIRVVEHQPGLNDLHTAYLAEADTWPGRNSMIQNHMQEAASNLARDIIVGANLKWDRDPDKTSREEQSDAG